MPAVDAILSEFAQEPGRASLALNVRQLHLPFQATISVAISARIASGDAPNEWRLHIEAEHNPAVYPKFDGVLSLTSDGCSSRLQLDGTYIAPFGAVGRAIDVTLLRGAARSSLDRFVRELAYRVAALSRWAAP
ncbi:MAG TPA: hypothetical protein VJP85_04145 [Candidatus Baltobacteraceae bacterium]|nr:hypothetical protein [Candidatus Baltobacteraceae bacterium]